MDKPVAWYDPTNGAVSTDKDSPMFTPLGQVWGLYLKKEWVGLTDEEKNEITWGKTVYEILELAEAKLKEKNHG
jgi:hypothetical protein